MFPVMKLIIDHNFSLGLIYPNLFVFQHSGQTFLEVIHTPKFGISVKKGSSGGKVGIDIFVTMPALQEAKFAASQSVTCYHGAHHPQTCLVFDFLWAVVCLQMEEYTGPVYVIQSFGNHVRNQFHSPRPRGWNIIGWQPNQHCMSMSNQSGGRHLRPAPIRELLRSHRSRFWIAVFLLVHSIQYATQVSNRSCANGLTPWFRPVGPVNLTVFVLPCKMSLVLLKLSQPAWSLRKSLDDKSVTNTDRTSCMVCCSPDSEAVLEVSHPNLKGWGIETLMNNKTHSCQTHSESIGSPTDVNSFIEIFSCGISAVQSR